MKNMVGTTKENVQILPLIHKHPSVIQILNLKDFDNDEKLNRPF